MRVEFDLVAKKVGELYAAARHDISTADPADVTLNGVPVLGWRQAYAEGCRDMAAAVGAGLQEGEREEAKRLVLAAFEETAAGLKAEASSNPSPNPSPQGGGERVDGVTGEAATGAAATSARGSAGEAGRPNGEQE